MCIRTNVSARLSSTQGILLTTASPFRSPVIFVREKPSKRSSVDPSVPCGSNYVVTLEALNCRTGDTIARQQVEAGNKEKVLAALGTAAKALRGPLGEGVNTIERFSAPIEQATTSSLEAMKAYALGDEKRAKDGDLASLPFYKRAAELDPNFAMAYARMGAVYGNSGEVRLAQESTQKAFDLRERTSEREKFYITAHYYSDVTGEVYKSIENYELWIQTYPRDWTPRNNLVGDYLTIGENQKLWIRP